MLIDKNADERSVSWKILLPIAPESKILAIGISDGELNGLARSFGRVDTLPNDSKYDAVVFGCQIPEQQEPKQYVANMSSNCVIVSLGSSSICDMARHFRWHYAAEYACLPPSRPRIFMPLSIKRFRNNGLIFHSPGSLQGKALHWGAKALSSIGITAHLRRKTVTFFTISRQIESKSSVKRWISGRAGWPVNDMVVYAGSETESRKITALATSYDCRNSIVAKIADTPLAADSIKQESTALRALYNSSLAPLVPTLIDEGMYGSYRIQLQSYLPQAGRQYQYLSNAHIKFLSDLSRINRTRIRFYSTTEWPIVKAIAIHRMVDKSIDPIRQIATSLLASGIADIFIDCHMTHGDFSPWNIIYRNNFILAFDWEDSQPLGFPFQDLFHFIFRQASLVGPWPGATVIMRFMRDAASRLAHSSAIACHVDHALRVWCINEFIAKPSTRLMELAEELARIGNE